MAQLNLLIAWVWIGLGFLSGMVLGLGFNREHWLGGYASWKRRLYRLGHISFFGLGLVNLMYYFTAREAITREAWGICGLGFVVGAVTMPVCCLIVAHFPKAKALFAIPVVSLLLAAGLTVDAIATHGTVAKIAASCAPSVRWTTPKAPNDPEANSATTALAANRL